MYELVEYTSNGQKVQLSPDTVKKYLVSGSKNTVTDQEIVLFMNLCEARGLNPWKREAYLVKYGDNPAQIIVGKDAILKVAMQNPSYGKHQAGIVVVNREGKIENREGSLLLPREELVGGWCDVVKVAAAGAQEIHHTVSFDEYALRDREGKLMSNWKVKPATMIRKVALCQALREAFPEDTAGMYEAEEMGVDDKTLATTPIDQSKVVADITPMPNQSTVEDHAQPVTEPSKPVMAGLSPETLMDMLDMSDVDFLSAPFTYNGVTKMVGQIKLDSWKKIRDYKLTTPNEKDVAIRAISLLDNSMYPQDDPFKGTPLE